jgi:hypothetical protein
MFTISSPLLAFSFMNIQIRSLARSLSLPLLLLLLLLPVLTYKTLFSLTLKLFFYVMAEGNANKGAPRSDLGVSTKFRANPAWADRSFCFAT